MIIVCEVKIQVVLPKNQKLVVYDVIEQIKNGNKSIGGLMIESNINEGKQSIILKNMVLVLLMHVLILKRQK